MDVEKDDLTSLGLFDVVFCYGLLYHIEKPELVLEKLAQVCSSMLILETCITDHPEPFNLWVEETYAYNQALQGIGSRPTVSFIVSSLHQAGFTHVYIPKNAPKHRDFVFDYHGDLSHTKEGHPLRQIFIATKEKLINENLYLISAQKKPLPQSSLFANKTAGSQKLLSKLSVKELTQFAQQIYKPLPLVPVPDWSVGKLELDSHFHRFPLRFLWEELGKRNKNHDRILSINWYNNLRLMLYPRNEICRCIYVEGCYEPNEFYFLLQYLRPGMTVVDVGANIGLYTLFAASLVGRKGTVIAFEPSDREYHRLMKSISLNSLTNIRAKKMALGNKPESKVLLIADEGHEGHNTLGNFAYAEVGLKQKEIVEVGTLDNLLRKNKKISRVDVIKIDSEGSELFVLEGAKKTIAKHAPVIILELSDKTLQKQNSRSSQIWKFLQVAAYNICQFDRRSGKLVPGKLKHFFAGENIVAIPKGKQKLTNYL